MTSRTLTEVRIPGRPDHSHQSGPRRPLPISADTIRDTVIAASAARCRTIPRISTAELDRNPHGVFRRFRRLTPLLEGEDGSYIALRSVDIDRLFVDQRIRQLEAERVRSLGIEDGALFDLLANTMLLSNGATHYRRRAPLSRAFAYRLEASIRPRIRKVADDLLTRHLGRRQMSFRDDYAGPVAVRTIGLILDLPEQDLPQFANWIYNTTHLAGLPHSGVELPAIEQAAHELVAYIGQLLAARRATPRDDFLTDYVVMVEQEGELSAAEALAQLIIMILAGSDITRTALVMQVALLLQHREQWDAVCRNPALIPAAVSEALRYEPPVGFAPRFTLDDVEVGGEVIPARRVLMLSTLSAMRDPALYSDPDCFNIFRSEQHYRHLAFGEGPHRCLGEVLARTQLQETLTALVERVPQLRLVDGAPFITGHAGIRNVSEMGVAW
jgi:cytochrome P450 family 103